jgi:TetR/AcrR family transcriptional regulator, regulator of cefoperazone and chloramphenicol sensitivity
MDKETAETRQRLLETAATVFAEHGFAAATIRIIAGRARVNVAAVNYHFGSKDGLYREVLRHVRRRAYERYPTTYGLNGEATAEERLHAYIRSFLLRTVGEDSVPGFGVLMMREMVEPTCALDMIVDEGIRSLFEQLVEIVRLLMGEESPGEEVLECARSTISQCVFYLFGRSVISRMAPERKFDQGDIEKIAGHITTFTLHALKGMAADKACGGTCHPGKKGSGRKR